MKRILTILALLSAVAFQVNAQTYDWSDLIGKKLVLSRWGRFVDGIFLDYRFTNPAGEKPVEQLMAHPDFSVADLHRPCMTA